MLFSAVTGTALSAPQSWSPSDTLSFTKTVEISAGTTGVRELLKEFFREQGVLAVIDESVTGTISGNFTNTDPQEFLRVLCDAYGLIWSYDGNIVFVEDEAGIRTKLLTATDVDPDNLREQVAVLGIACSRARVSFAEDGLILVSGPMHFTDLLSKIIHTIQTHTENKDIIKVFPLKHAWAYDLTFDYGEGEFVLPGIVTVLENLGGQGATSGSPSMMSSSDIGGPNPISPMASGGTTGSSASFAPNSSGSANAATSESLGGAQSAQMRFGLLNNMNLASDTRLNAIIAEGPRHHMHDLESLLSQLDKPLHVIAISVAIVDVEVGNSLGLGMRSFSVGKGDSTGGFTTIGPQIQQKLPDDGNVSAHVITNGFDFLASVEALEEKGEAKVISRPSVITFDNMEAIISRDQTFYVEVAGTYASSLFSISAGLVLKVIPHLVQEGEGEHINMILSIQNGQIEGVGSDEQSVKGLPIVEESKLNTQAILRQGQSILVGGLYSKTDINADSGIPFFKDIPVLGYLFKTDYTSSDLIETLFLITPTVLEMNYSSPVQYESYFRISPQSSAVPQDQLMVNPTTTELGATVTEVVPRQTMETEPQTANDKSPKGIRYGPR